MEKLMGLVLLVAGFFLMPFLVGIPMMLIGARCLSSDSSKS